MKALALTLAMFCLAACHSSNPSSASGGSASGGSASGGNTAPTDADRDGFAASADCNDNDASVWQNASFFTDADGDGHGAATAVSVCSGAATPAGYSSSSNDCADDDATVHVPMPYAARDADEDTFLVTVTGSVCGNGSTLPPTYFAVAGSGAEDCDDGSASVWRQISLHPDFDGDGVGHGTQSTFCMGTSPIPGFVSSNIDCDPLDATKWRTVATYEDVDGDGVGSGPLEHACVGAAPPTGLSFLGFDPLDTTDPGSSLVSDFDLNLSSLFIESEVDDDNLFP